ncbi:MAG: sulfotransferase, partial [bacterium]|nr:sulfotransferase [bacterium]
MKATMMKGPDFICVGAQKGGTQWLYDQLAYHPDFWMPPVKEFHYFDLGKRASRARKQASLVRPTRRIKEAGTRSDMALPGVPDVPLEERDKVFLEEYTAGYGTSIEMELYCGLFRHSGSQLTGDVTPAYGSLHRNIIDLIASELPDMKIVFIAREPVSRLWSQYCMSLRSGKEIGPATVDSVIRFARRPIASKRSFPSKIVRKWRRSFPNLGLFFFD